MFNNISGKIKLIAKIMCWVGIIFFGGLGIIFIFSGVDKGDIDHIGYAIMYIMFAFAAWACSYMVYGFGQLIENTNSLNGVEVIPDDKEEITKAQYERVQDIMREKKNNEIMKEVATWYLDNFDEDEERKKAIEEFIKKH